MERTTTTRRTAAKGRGGKRRKVTTGPPEPEEDDVLNLADKIVSIELISREVFRRLDFNDLLNCSLVNHTWRASARLHLRSHCRCFLSFSTQTMRLKQRKFCDLYDLLKNSSDVPFNGISIDTPFEVETSSDESAEEGNEVNQFQEAEDRFISAREWKEALGRLEAKYLELDWWAEPYSPPSRMAIKEILRRSSSTLVDLTVVRWDSSRGMLIILLRFFRGNVLPNVKVLQLPGRYCGRLNVVDLEDLLNALPRLQSIRGTVDLLSLSAFVRTNKQHTIHEFNFSTSSASELEVVNEKTAEELLELATTFARSQPKLTKLTLLTAMKGFRSLLPPGSYFGVTEALVRGGAEVLKEVEIDYGDLLPLINPFPVSKIQCHSSPLFPAVTSLSIHDEFGIVTGFGTTSFYNLNLVGHFPLLQSVELDCDILSHFLPFGDERRTEEHYCKSVRRLVLRNTWVLRMARTEATWMASFTRLFPMVRVLMMEDCSELQGICESLWGKGRALWEELRMLRLEGFRETTVRMNWDPLFTGLSREDCEILKTQSKPDIQFFGELRLKPLEEREGSLLNLKKLEKLQFGMEHDDVCENGWDAKNAFVSKLIGERVWALMGLRVEISRRFCRKKLECCLALTHLQPFVHFVDEFTN